MKRNILDIIFWTACTITLAHCWAAFDLGSSAEGGAAIGRAVVCAGIVLVSYYLMAEES